MKEINNNQKIEKYREKKKIIRGKKNINNKI